MLTEAMYYLREDGLDVDPVFQMIDRGAIEPAFDVSSHWPRLRALIARYDRMDLAHASLAS